MNDAALWVGFIIGAYLLGSVPFALLIGRACGVDIRKHGSGNVGATNVLRVCGRPAGVACFALDFLKGLGPVVGAGIATGAIGAPALSAASAWLWLGVAGGAIAGHIFPIWLRFRGGKGVATGFGALLGVAPYLTGPSIAAFVVWLLSMRLSRNVGLSSSIAAAVFPALVWLGTALGSSLEALPSAPLAPFLTASLALAALVLVRHRENLWRTYIAWRERSSAKNGADRS